MRLHAHDLSLDGARDALRKKAFEVEFKPTGDTNLDTPKEGEHDPENKSHSGGNRWAAGVGLKYSRQCPNDDLV